MEYKFFDYFTGKSLLVSDSPSGLSIYDIVKVPDFADVLMVYALHAGRRECLLAPAQGGKPPLAYSFVENKLVCQKCGMTCPMAILENNNMERHGQIWDRGLNLDPTIKVMEHIDKTHQTLCDLIRPVILTA